MAKAEVKALAKAEAAVIADQLVAENAREKALAKEKLAAAKAEKLAAKILVKQFNSNSEFNKIKCKTWRICHTIKLASATIIRMAESANSTIAKSRPQRGIPRKDYNENVITTEVSVPGQGKGVSAVAEILPATFLFEYGGKKIKDTKIIQYKLANGNNKILQVRQKQLWWDGESSKTLGPKLNHACNCVSNCEIIWNGDIPSKASDQGHIKKGEYLTLDYGYDTKNLRKDKDMKWYVQYLRTHKCGR